MKGVGQGVVTAGILGTVVIIIVGLFGHSDDALRLGEPQADRLPSGGTSLPVAVNVAMMGQPPLSFATPETVVKVPPVAALPEFVSAKIKKSEAHWQGMETLPLTTELKKKLNYPMNVEGVRIDEVSLQSARAGLLAGDVLVAINNRPVLSLEDMYRESRKVQNRKSAMLMVYRNGAWMSFKLVSMPGENLGFTQVETAPMVLPGDIRPHPYRGPCTDCHAIGVTGHLVPDPDGIILPPPTIRVGVGRPHQDRGPCVACHKIVP
ncbi:MAG TPA: magnetochrome domain-containing protein [Magnetococcales bacterium]|nr:magnetochrome domain-containing protein [Magnetococcales bacterium]